MIASYAIGVDVGGSRIYVGLVDTKGRVVKDAKTLTPKDKGPFAIVDTIIGLVKEVTVGVPSTDIAGIGVGVPAQVDFRRQEIEYCTNLPLTGIDVRSLLHTGLRLPVCMDNDSHLAAFGEARYGAARDVDDFLMVTLGTGVGGGLWFNGKPYRGHRGLGAEVGHIVVNVKGPECPCGGKGHLEAYLGRPAIARLGQQIADDPIGRAILKEAGGNAEDIDAEAIIAAARKGDEMAKSILSDLGGILGQALVSFVNALNPQLICIGGGVGEIADELVATAAHTVNTQALAGRKDVSVIQGTLGNDAGILGAAALAFDEYESREGFHL